MVQFFLTDYNNTNEKRHAQLKYDRKLNTPFDDLYCTKFRLQTQTFPAFIPIITNETSKLKLNGASEVPVTKELSKFKMNWSICMHDLKTNTYANMCVYWQPQKDQDMSPLNFPSRFDVINNPYFYAYNSLHVLKLIQNTLTELGNVLAKVMPVEIIKEESAYQLLISNTEDIKVYFNYDLAQVFAFHYTTIPGNRDKYSEIVFDRRNTRKFFNKTYFVSQVLGMSTRMFPFSDIQFTTSELQIENIQSTINTKIEMPNNSPIILSYTLNVEDIDAIVDNFNFSINTINHPTKITNSNFPDVFYVKAQFKTFDNYYLPVMLDKNDSLNMFIVMV